MNLLTTTFFSLLLLVSISNLATGNSNDYFPKQRVIVLTDIENEPDDAQSLVRFLL